MGWYFARIWIEITPLHVHWWPSRALEEPAQTWHAPEGTAAPLSDPAPTGSQPGAWIAPPVSWRDTAADASARLTLQDLTVVDTNGFPLCVPVKQARLIEDGFVLQFGPGVPECAGGSACLTFHGHPEVFTGQENHTFVGTVTASERTTDGGTTATMHVERALADWSIVGGKARSSLGFLSKGRQLSPRLRTEAARRFQPVPVVRFPTEH
jgi:hypothetical protein